MEVKTIKGKGAQINPVNQFSAQFHSSAHVEGIDDFETDYPKTALYYEQPKTIISRFESPDVPHGASINPYQGCEHGCVYCYARNSHEYWGFSAGLDFESKIIVKKNAPQLLEKQFLNKSWRSHPIMMSGNTDCYQPMEKKLKLTRQILEVFLKLRNPVSLITKNSLILRDLDILRELASLDLVHVMISINSLDETGRNRPRCGSERYLLRGAERGDLRSHGSFREREVHPHTQPDPACGSHGGGDLHQRQGDLCLEQKGTHGVSSQVHRHGLSGLRPSAPQHGSRKRRLRSQDPGDAS